MAGTPAHPSRRVAAADLMNATGRPRPFAIIDRTSVQLSRPASGPVVPVRCAAFLSRLDGPGALTFLGDAAFADALTGVEGCAVVTTAALAGAVPAGNAVLVAPDGVRPRDEYYAVLADLVVAGGFETLAGRVDPDADVHPSAIVGPDVVVAAGAVVGPGTVLAGATYVGPGVVIKPNAVIGTDGFEVMVRDGRRRIFPHAGGVWLSSGVHVGGSTCIDRGAFGEHTFVGADTMIDNLVHVAHSVSIGSGCSVVAGAKLNGSCVIGDDTWIAPNAIVRQGVHVGRGCLVSLGAVVHKDLPGHVQAGGNPMRIVGHVCSCRHGLRFGDEPHTVCEACGTAYERLPDGGARPRS